MNGWISLFLKFGLISKQTPPMRTKLVVLIYCFSVIACTEKPSLVNTLLNKEHLSVDTIYNTNGNIDRIVISDSEYTKEQLIVDNELNSTFAADLNSILNSTPRNSTVITFDSLNKPQLVEYNTNIIYVTLDSTFGEISVSYQKQIDSSKIIN